MAQNEDQSFEGGEEYVEKEEPDEDSKEKQYEDRFACLQGWFLRASHIVKIHTVEALLTQTNGPQILRIILRAIASSNTKDAVYAKSQMKTRHVYDRVLQDDNRAMDSDRLAQALEDDVLWFGDLSEKKQVAVFCGLLILGGGGTMRFGYEAASQLLERRALDARIAVQDAKRKSVPSGFPLIDRQFNTDTLPPEVNARVASERKQWDAAIEELKKNLGLFPGDGKKPKGRKEIEEDQCVDRVQLLPIWGNRHLCEFIPKKTLEAATRVNKYWAEMLKDFKNAKAVRKYLQKEIDKSSDTARKKTAKRQRMKEAKSQKGRKKAESPKRKEEAESKEQKDLATTEELERQRGEEGIRESFENARIPVSRNTYVGRHMITRVVEEYLHTRKLAVDPKGFSIAMTKPFRAIGVYSLLTGSELYPRLTGHTALITCLEYCPEGDYVVSGSVDQTLRLWDIWGEECLKVFTGHRAPLTALSMSRSDLLASADRNREIRLWHLWSGDLLHSISGETEDTALEIVLKNNCIFVGTEEGKLKTYTIKSQVLRPYFGEILEVIAHDGPVTALAFEPPLVITASNDGFIKVWRCEGLVGPLHTLDNKEPVRCLAFSYMKIFSGGSEGNLRMWDCITGQLLRVHKMSPDVRHIMSISCIEYRDHSKVVVNMETGVNICEYPNVIVKDKPIPKRHTFPNKSGAIDSQAGNEEVRKAKRDKPVPGRLSLLERRLENLSRKCCTLPELRRCSHADRSSNPQLPKMPGWCKEDYG